MTNKQKKLTLSLLDGVKPGKGHKHYPTLAPTPTTAQQAPAPAPAVPTCVSFSCREACAQENLADCYYFCGMDPNVSIFFFFFFFFFLV